MQYHLLPADPGENERDDAEHFTTFNGSAQENHQHDKNVIYRRHVLVIPRHHLPYSDGITLNRLSDSKAQREIPRMRSG